jgi:hypothetical protein
MPPLSSFIKQPSDTIIIHSCFSFLHDPYPSSCIMVPPCNNCKLISHYPTFENSRAYRNTFTLHFLSPPPYFEHFKLPHRSPLITRSTWLFSKRQEVGEASKLASNLRIQLHLQQDQRDVHHFASHIQSQDVMSYQKQTRPSSPRFLERI